MSSLTSVLAMLDFGIGNGLVNLVATSDGKGGNEPIRNGISNAAMILVLQAALLGVALAVLLPRFDVAGFFQLQSSTAIQDGAVAVMAFAALFVMGLPTNLIQKVNTGLQEGYVNNVVQGVSGILGLLAILLVVRLELGLPMLIVTTMGVAIVGSLGNWVIALRRRPWLLPSLPRTELAGMKQLMLGGIGFFVIDCVMMLGVHSDNILISHIFGASAVASYAVLQKLGFIGSSVFQILSSPLWPAYAEALARGDTNWVRKAFSRSLLVCSGIGGCVALLLLVFGKPLISIWVGPNLIPSTVLLLGFCFSIVVVSLTTPLSVLLCAGPLLKPQVVMHIIAGLSAVVAKVLLSSVIGVAGVIWATGICYLTFYVGPGLYVVLRFLRSKNVQGTSLERPFVLEG